MGFHGLRPFPRESEGIAARHHGTLWAMYKLLVISLWVLSVPRESVGILVGNRGTPWKLYINAVGSLGLPLFPLCITVNKDDDDIRVSKPLSYSGLPSGRGRRETVVGRGRANRAWMRERAGKRRPASTHGLWCWVG